MAPIVLATLNARYIHASFGLRYLKANLGELRDRAVISEFEVTDRTLDICERILSENPQIVGFGVYIWNVRQTEGVIAALKRLRPELIIIIGGPEVSFETEGQRICDLSDYVVTGEGDHVFRDLCVAILNGVPPEARIVNSEPPKFETLSLPYGLYTEADVRNRVVYVEASRGCPFTCEFCLSSLEVPVRQAPLEPFLAEMDALHARGARQFKFVDRTFNLNIQIGARILEFFLERLSDDLFVHFEMVPDRLPEKLRGLITRFPPGTLQFEIGIQTFNPEVAALISRRQNYEKVAENLTFLRTQTGVHVHADLIFGLPGESLESFGAGFNRLIELGPQEIQVGILKRLRGTPIIRHDEVWGMRYNPEPPYEILENRLVDFSTVQRVSRFARYWDIVANSGNFKGTIPLLWAGSRSPFESFLEFSDWLYGETGERSGFAVKRMAEFLFRYLSGALKVPESEVAKHLLEDFYRCGRDDIPSVLRGFETVVSDGIESRRRKLPARQSRHLAG